MMQTTYISDLKKLFKEIAFTIAGMMIFVGILYIIYLFNGFDSMIETLNYTNDQIAEIAVKGIFWVYTMVVLWGVVNVYKFLKLTFYHIKKNSINNL